MDTNGLDVHPNSKVTLPSFGDLIKSISCQTEYYCTLCHGPLIHAQMVTHIINASTVSPGPGDPSLTDEDYAVTSHHFPAGSHGPHQNAALRSTTSHLDTPAQGQNDRPTVYGKKRSPKTMGVQFTDVAAHTAKCDICDKRNRDGMSRCLTCGWQCCRLCQVDKKGDRSHNSFSHRHEEELPVSSKSQVQLSGSGLSVEDFERRNPPRRARPSNFKDNE
ncbi:hypothetical protein N7495_004255 [Penicillium taxi]|uniref:uncharacterized protein n=1 Tax=Penicillium taxi TaxID=168475 RepID=UPI002544EE6F|nr:uncharacterized protein N7495_004255 [Penicillium taxi]KAJ5899511.1 hypothetical protein N7495_004255 [Penicillium taxi]